MCTILHDFIILSYILSILGLPLKTILGLVIGLDVTGSCLLISFKLVIGVHQCVNKYSFSQFYCIISMFTDRFGSKGFGTSVWC